MKKITIIGFVMVLCMFLSNIFLTQPSWATEEKYPSKEIHQIVPWRAGGGTDLFTRVLERLWEKKLGVPIVIENIPGGGTTIGNNKAWNAPADGYTILVVNIGALNFSAMLHNTEWTIEDWTYIGLHHTDPIIVYAHPSVPWNNIKDVMDYIIKDPGKLNVGVPESTNDQIILIKMIEEITGGKFGSIIPAGGGGKLLKEVMGGHIPLAFHRLWAGGIKAKAQNLKPIGIVTSKRNPLWPELPTFDEVLPLKWRVKGPLFGYKGYAVHKKVKEKYPERFNKLVSTFKEIFDSPEHKQAADKMKLTPILDYKGPEEAMKAIKEYDEMLRKYKHLFRIGVQ
ncbi:MAG: tripartite tricarboxylate transporter substrate binding protein [Nitrospirota bacterium]